MKESNTPSLGTVVREIGTSVKELAQGEVDLLKAEIRESSKGLGKLTAQTAIFSCLVALSVLPFLAFLVIGLGDLMGGRYWLSSLLVSIVCAAIGGTMAYRSYHKLSETDFSLPRTRHSLEESRDVISHKMEEVKNSTKGRVA